MPARPLIRVVLSLGVIAVLWLRAARLGGGWVAGSIAMTVLLALVIVVEITQARNKYRSPKDEVPKRPLGLG